MKISNRLLAVLAMLVFAGCTTKKSGDHADFAILVTPVSGATTEGGGQASFAVALNAKPGADVVLHFSSSMPTEGAVSTSSLTFTTVNFAAPQVVTVTGVDDAVADGAQTYAINFGATTSTDKNYDGQTPAAIPVVNIDNDSAGITVSPVSGATTEIGGTATFSVVLNSQPTDTVTLHLNSTVLTEGAVSSSNLTFTTVNFAAPQIVTVTGQDDFVADGNKNYAVHFGATTSNDPTYAALTPADVHLTNIDNETAQILVSAASGPTTEGGGTATFTVVLTSQPVGDVTVNFDTGNANEGIPDATSLLFTSGDYSTPKTVTLTGVNDDVADGNQPYSVNFTATTSADTQYAAITPASVALLNIDNDSPGILVTQISGPTSEAGGTATFDVVLTSRPTDDVTVNFDTNDPTEGTPNVTSLLFPAADFATPQTVTVTGVDDNLADGNQPYAIVFGSTVSNDLAYAAITPPNVLAVNFDNEPPPVIVTGSVAVYLRSTIGAPWGGSTDEQAMDMAYGVGNWLDLRYETVTVPLLFSPSVGFVYMDGGDNNAIALETFLTQNQPSIENWVFGGGSLFITAAPNEDDGMSFGFGGVTLNYPSFGDNSGVIPDPNHPIWLGPFLPTTQTFTGDSFAHATVTGGGLSPLIFAQEDPANPRLAEKPYGAGRTLFGGLTLTEFWNPAPEAMNLRANMIKYLTTRVCPPEDVEMAGKCYYLDGSGGACDAGYVLAPQSVLNFITDGFAGKNYKHQVSGNCCIWNSDPDEDFGMANHCNAPGPFDLGDVAAGAIGCTDQVNQDPSQLTFCVSQ